MKKMLYCASNWTHIRNFHLPYIRFFSEHGYDVHVAASGIPLDADLPVIREIPFRKNILSSSNIKVLLELKKLLEREQYEVIYVHTSLAAFFCRAALALSSLKGTRLVYMCHGYFFRQDGEGKVEKSIRSLFYLFCEKLLAAKTDKLLLMNKMDYQSALRYELGKKIEFVHGMGLVEENHPPVSRQEASRLRQEWGIPRDAVVYGCVGEFSKRKNQEMIIDAFSKIQNRQIDSRLVFAGDGALMRKCVELVKAYQLEEQVIFCGQVQDIREVYAVMDVLVTASESEGLPFCVMEAMHYGIPVVASKVKGHTDLITHGENGCLFYLEVDKLAGCMEAYADAGRKDEPSSYKALPEAYYYQSVMEEILRHGGFEVEAMPLAH